MGVRLPRPKQRRKGVIFWIIPLIAIAALVSMSRMPEFTPAQTPVQTADADDQRPVTRPTRPQPDPVQNPLAAAAYRDKLALQSHGDIRRLSPDDQTFLSGMTPRYAAKMLRSRYQYLQAQRQGHVSKLTPQPKT